MGRKEKGEGEGGGEGERGRRRRIRFFGLGRAMLSALKKTKVRGGEGGWGGWKGGGLDLDSLVDDGE